MSGSCICGQRPAIIYHPPRPKFPDQVGREHDAADRGKKSGGENEHAAHGDDGGKKTGGVDENAEIGIFRRGELIPPARQIAEEKARSKDHPKAAAHIRFAREGG